MKILKLLTFSFSLLLLTSCHCSWKDEPTTPFRLGHVLCTDGSVMSLCDFLNSSKEPIGIVFHVNEDPESDYLGYAVYIHDTENVAFAETLNVSQGTSASLEAEDGNENTYAIYATEDVKSPMAMQVFDMWKYGQSAYIPAVAQLRLLFANKTEVNRRIEAVGGTPISDDEEDCWLWSSTEVAGQQADKAWLFSMNYGSILETPKNQPHKIRPVITIKR